MSFYMKISIVLIVFFIFFLSFTTCVFAQNTKVDSLKVELQNHKDKDTTKVNLLNALAFSYFSKDMSKTLEYLGEADEISEAIDFKKGKAKELKKVKDTDITNEVIQNSFLKIHQSIGTLKDPEKLKALKEAGLRIVERVPIIVEAQEPAAHYLRTKQEKMGHLLDIDE